MSSRKGLEPQPQVKRAFAKADRFLEEALGVNHHLLERDLRDDGIGQRPTASAPPSGP